MSEGPTLSVNNEHSFSPFVRIFAAAISFVFHPLFVGIYIAAFIIYWDPTLFLALNEKGKLLKLLTFVNNNFIFPVLVVLLLKGLGFSRSILLQSRRDRIIPYSACIIFFFWTWYVFRNQPETPRELADMCQGIFFAACIAFISNAYFKISMHAVGVGGLVGLMIILLFNGTMASGQPLAFSLLVAGIVITARMINSDHHWMDLILGFAVGLIGQVMAFWVF
jgi:hypothetical protein